MCNRKGTESCWDVNRMKAGRTLSKFMVNKNDLLLRSQILKKTKESVWPTWGALR